MSREGGSRLSPVMQMKAALTAGTAVLLSLTAPVAHGDQMTPRSIPSAVCVKVPHVFAAAGVRPLGTRARSSASEGHIVAAEGGKSGPLFDLAWAPHVRHLRENWGIRGGQSRDYEDEVNVPIPVGAPYVNTR